MMVSIRLRTDNMETKSGMYGLLSGKEATDAYFTTKLQPFMEGRYGDVNARDT